MQGVQRSIESFRGDFQILADVIQRSWAENSQQGLSYSPEFLESFLTSPGATTFLAPAFYQDDVLIGFASGFPRQVEYLGHPLKLITSSFLSVLPEYKKFGFGIVLWSELVKRARADGFDGMLNFCVDGELMNRMVEGCCRRLNLPVHRIFSIRYMSSLLKSEAFAASSARSSVNGVDDFLKLAAPLVTSQPLARRWTREEAEWQCLHRTGGVFAHSVHGPRSGILTGYVLPILDRDGTKCLLVEDVFWDELRPEERLQLLHEFLAQAVLLGAQMATVPILHYADLGAFRKLRFFPTRRVLNCYLTFFNGNLALEKLPSMYVDVF
jgi:GNAT superfamily N-acetyltransferase